jgi:hypothetical protein
MRHLRRRPSDGGFAVAFPESQCRVCGSRREKWRIDTSTSSGCRAMVTDSKSVPLENAPEVIRTGPMNLHDAPIGQSFPVDVGWVVNGVLLKAIQARQQAAKPSVAGSRSADQCETHESGEPDNSGFDSLPNRRVGRALSNGCLPRADGPDVGATPPNRLMQSGGANGGGTLSPKLNPLPESEARQPRRNVCLVRPELRGRHALAGVP